METTMKNTVVTKIMCLLAVSALISACANQDANRALYNWGEYQDLQYQAFDDAAQVGKQVAGMEKYFQEASGKGMKPAPGAHAHLGMLYVKTGNIALAKDQFELERKLFPEANQYMGFVLKNVAGGS